ncbi:MAG TPA: chloride channel protein [Planctomycetota bacterium]|nr:chloride channel protein [Planctomycetota bacterium]
MSEGDRHDHVSPQSELKLLGFSAMYLLRWGVYAALIGAAVATVSFAFEWTLWQLRELTLHTWLYGLPVAGGLLTAVVIRRERRAACDGIQVYIDSATSREYGPGLRVLPMKFIASVFTLGTGGSGGRFGPAVLMGGTFGAWASHLGGRDREVDRHTAAMCGAAAAIGALLGTPLGGGIFAAEVLSPSSIRYRGLFPAILASTVGCVLRRGLFPPVWRLAIPQYGFEMRHILPVLGVAVVAGLVGLLFTSTYQAAERKARELRRIAWVLPAIGAALVVVLAWVSVLCGVEGTEIMGTGAALFADMMKTSPVLLAGVALLVLKSLATVSTVATGGSGGLFYPSLLLGGLVGNVVAVIFGAAEPVRHALLGAGMAASLASVVNVPVAAAVMMIEMFGTGLGVPIVAGAAVGFMIGRPSVIYHYGRRGVHFDDDATPPV